MVSALIIIPAGRSMYMGLSGVIGTDMRSCLMLRLE